MVDERDGKGLGDNSVAVVKKLYKVNIAGAQEISNITGASSLLGTAAPKTLFLDIVAVLNSKGIASTDIPAKLEGIAFGQDVTINGATQHTLYVSNDNDFVATVIDSTHPLGMDNPNKFFVFAFEAADLPGLVPQDFNDLYLRFTN